MNYKKKYLKYKLKYLNLKKKMKGGEGFLEAVQNLGEKVSNSCSTVCKLKKEFKELGEGCFEVCEAALGTVVGRQTARVVAQAAADAAVGAAVGAVEDFADRTVRGVTYATGIPVNLLYNLYQKKENDSPETAIEMGKLIVDEAADVIKQDELSDSLSYINNTFNKGWTPQEIEFAVDYINSIV